MHVRKFAEHCAEKCVQKYGIDPLVLAALTEMIIAIIEAISQNCPQANRESVVKAVAQRLPRHRRQARRIMSERLDCCSNAQFKEHAGGIQDCIFDCCDECSEEEIAQIVDEVRDPDHLLI